MKLLSVVIGVVLTFLISSTVYSEETGKVQWKINLMVPKVGYMTTGYGDPADFAADVITQSGGRFEITPYYGGELGHKASDFLKVSRHGLAQMSEISYVFVAGSMPELSVPILPFLLGTEAEWFLVSNKLLPTYKQMFKDKWNTIILYTLPWPTQLLGTNKQINNIKDFEGMKIRVSGWEQSELVKRWGAVPVTTTMPEMYPALQRGTVDGVLTPAVIHLSFKLYEVSKYIMSTPGINLMVSSFSANKNAFETLSKNFQQVLLEAGKKQERKVQAEAEARSHGNLKKLTSAGAIVYAASPEVATYMRTPASEVWKAWAKDKSQTSQELLKSVREVLRR